MDVLTVILLLVIIILLISNKFNINEKLNNLDLRILELQNLLRKQTFGPKPEEKPWTAFSDPLPFKTPPAPRPAEPPLPPKPSPPPVPEREPEPSLPTKTSLPLVPEREPVIERHKEVIAGSLANLRKPAKPWEPAPQSKEPDPSFFERYPDLEKFIGENLVNKIGIAILVLAIAFFVKYAIDNNWVGPVGRVGIGIVCGGILIGFAHRMRNSYKAFSSVLVGGGLAIFYFTITLAYQQFHLFAQPVALAILVVITVFAVVLSLLYDKQELAVIALIGGFASPFMVSNGTANYNGLFIYLLILNVGLLTIAYYKAWRILNISAFVLSVLVFATILFTMPLQAFGIAFRFATVFYLLFFTINVINNIRENKAFMAIDFSILLINTALYFGAGLYLLTAMDTVQYRGLFSAGLAGLNLLLSFILFKNKKADPNILYLLIGITLTFVSLIAPIQLHGHYITLFWAAETVLLYWLYQKSAIKLMKLTSLIIWLAMLISLYIDLINIYSNSTLSLAIIANKGFITTVFVAVSSYLLFMLIKRDSSPDIYGVAVSKNIYRVTALLLLFLAGILEINHQFQFYYPATQLNTTYLSLYVAVFVYLFITIAAKVRADMKWQFTVGLLVCTIAGYLLTNSAFFGLLQDMLEHGKINGAHFMAHWMAALFIGLLFYKLIILCRDNLDDSLKNAAAWLLSAVVVLFLSLEVCLLSEELFYSAANTVGIIQTVYIKTGLPILWGLLSFALMWMGMRKKLRTFRIISLTLFSVTLLKLFLFDINNIPVAGKIAAFFCLGILLLIISFMYQKVKKIIVNDGPEHKD